MFKPSQELIDFTGMKGMQGIRPKKELRAFFSLTIPS